MHRRERIPAMRRLNGVPVRAGHTEMFSQPRLRGGRSHTHQYLWLDRLKLSFQPGRASFNLELTRLLVNTPLTAFRCCPLEVFDDVRDVNTRAINANLGQCLIKQLSGRPHEGSTDSIFLIPWLLSDDHDRGLGRPFAEDRLRCRSPEIPGLTCARG